jgi:hypothetical protein
MRAKHFEAVFTAITYTRSTHALLEALTFSLVIVIMMVIIIIISSTILQII